jgi:predicted anti-sigma-YlaC factor YlaD
MEHANCHNLLGSLSDYIDGDLARELCAEIERHLEGCENCRVVVDSLRKTVYLYHTAPPSASVPEDVRERLYLRLELGDFLEKKGKV